MDYFTDPSEASLTEGQTLWPLLRRNYQLGWVAETESHTIPDKESIVSSWNQDQAVFLPGIADVVSWQAEINQSHSLMKQTLDTAELSPQLDQEPYLERMSASFPLLASSMEEHDEQGIEKVYFDAEQNGEVVAEDLWCKASWLSFLDEDASLRFRFSFGMECLEDVAADPKRQLWAGALCDAMFPESAAITANAQILDLMGEVVEGEPSFVERIVYFNAPNGGAQMHHDVERGHAGVVFAQMSGSTFWLALAKPVLIDELIEFAGDDSNAAAIEAVLPEQEKRDELASLLADRKALSAYMDEFDHELVEAVMDRSPEFTEHLISRGYSYILNAGDVLLMPQKDLNTCVWHSVLCLGDEPGEALSFAVR